MPPPLNRRLTLKAEPIEDRDRKEYPMQRLRGPLASALCALLALPSTPLSAQAAPQSVLPPASRSAARPAYKSAQLRGDERILHALNRFTFGPRPGDLEAVKSMGLDRWFAQQLHP